MGESGRPFFNSFRLSSFDTSLKEGGFGYKLLEK